MKTRASLKYLVNDCKLIFDQVSDFEWNLLVLPKIESFWDFCDYKVIRFLVIEGDVSFYISFHIVT